MFSRAGKAFALVFRRVFRGDRMAGFTLLHRLGRMLYPRYYFVDPRIDWWESEQFRTFLARFGETENLNAKRQWMLSQLVRLTTGVPGDTAECGAYMGATSWLICDANRGRGRLHHVFDSFEGLSTPGANDGSHWSRGDLASSEAVARDHLAEFEAVRFYKGWIPERFAEVAERTFAFVHIDVDLEEPTRKSMEFFYTRTNAGGIILCDDYGHSTCPGATRAVDQFLADKDEQMISFPSGGGFMIKGVETASSPFSDAGSR